MESWRKGWLLYTKQMGGKVWSRTFSSLHPGAAPKSKMGGQWLTYSSDCVKTPASTS